MEIKSCLACLMEKGSLGLPWEVADLLFCVVFFFFFLQVSLSRPELPKPQFPCFYNEGVGLVRVLVN